MTAHPLDAEAADVRAPDTSDAAAAASFTRIFADDDDAGEPEDDIEGDDAPDTAAD